MVLLWVRGVRRRERSAGFLVRWRFTGARRRLMNTVGTTYGRRTERPAETPDLIPGYFARIDKGNLLTHREEIDLSKRAKAGDDRARQRLGEEELRSEEQAS